ncbi:LacI family DNA-binding transcriptional regulator [Streptococcus infantarius]|uniref:LacI family DNA-binding transcriptional regulator n=1 Tax=Streptococcus infantarius TaxID=102684 RepID=UPI0022E7DC82|nr:LacI family DNA-binding transcriptional regulator [Streptococcus infantarius]
MTTIKNVAKLAGVSTSTASRALHNSDMISEATKERVRRAMQELDYSPNYTAQNLVNRTTNSIGIVLPVRERQDSLGNNPFFMQIIQGISSVCSEYDYMVSLASGRTVDELRKNCQALIRSGNISKFIFLYSHKDDPVFDFVKKQKKVSCVVVGSSYEKLATKSVQFVDNDNHQAGRDVAEFMVNKGFEHLVFAYTDMNELVQTERYQGCRDYLEEHQKDSLSLHFSRVKEDENILKLQQFLAEHPKTQVFIACDDIMAIRLQRLLKNGKQEKSYAVISFNNSLITEIANPALTSVDIFPYQLGEKAAQFLLEKSIKSVSQKVIIPHQIIERESTLRF